MSEPAGAPGVRLERIGQVIQTRVETVNLLLSHAEPFCALTHIHLYSACSLKTVTVNSWSTPSRAFRYLGSRPHFHFLARAIEILIRPNSLTSSPLREPAEENQKCFLGYPSCIYLLIICASALYEWPWSLDLHR